MLLRLPRVEVFVSINFFAIKPGSAARTELTGTSRVLPKEQIGKKPHGSTPFGSPINGVDHISSHFILMIRISVIVFKD